MVYKVATKPHSTKVQLLCSPLTTPMDIPMILTLTNNTVPSFSWHGPPAMGSRLLLFLMTLTAGSRSRAADQQLYRIGVGIGDITGPAAEIIMVRIYFRQVGEFQKWI